MFKFLSGERIIDVKDRHVNEYILSIVGEEFTAKDFRTWAGTLLCSIALAMEGQGSSKTERKRKIRKAIVATAGQLGNTPAVCRSSYICPRLLDEYMQGKPFETLRRTRKGSPVMRVGLSMEEEGVVGVSAGDHCGSEEESAGCVRMGRMGRMGPVCSRTSAQSRN